MRMGRRRAPQQWRGGRWRSRRRKQVPRGRGDETRPISLPARRAAQAERKSQGAMRMSILLLSRPRAPPP
eukprot:scaffold82109_cov26-Tisochrysis_lutea.AAC.3